MFFSWDMGPKRPLVENRHAEGVENGVSARWGVGRGCNASALQRASAQLCMSLPRQLVYEHLAPAQYLFVSLVSCNTERYLSQSLQPDDHVL